MATEDFSFPTISDTHPYDIDSPPLWNLSPVGSPNPYRACSEGRREKNRDKEDCFEGKFVTQSQRKSFSYVENRRRRFGGDEDEDDDDRMDMLWEDFNEELSSTTGSATSSSREGAELTYPSSLKVANKANTYNDALLSSKNRPGMMMLVKVMKKLFTLSNSQGKPRKRVR